MGCMCPWWNRDFSRPTSRRTSSRPLSHRTRTQAYAQYVERYNSRHDQFEWFASDPIKVARVIEKALSSRRPAFRYPVGLDARTGMFGARVLPERLFHALLDRATIGR